MERGGGGMTEAEAAARLAALAEEIAAHSRAYYQDDAPVISDAAFVALVIGALSQKSTRQQALLRLGELPRTREDRHRQQAAEHPADQHQPLGKPADDHAEPHGIDIASDSCREAEPAVREPAPAGIVTCVGRAV